MANLPRGFIFSCWLAWGSFGCWQAGRGHIYGHTKSQMRVASTVVRRLGPRRLGTRLLLSAAIRERLPSDRAVPGGLAGDLQRGRTFQTRPHVPIPKSDLLIPVAYCGLRTTDLRLCAQIRTHGAASFGPSRVRVRIRRYMRAGFVDARCPTTIVNLGFERLWLKEPTGQSDRTLSSPVSSLALPSISGSWVRETPVPSSAS